MTLAAVTWFHDVRCDKCQTHVVTLGTWEQCNQAHIRAFRPETHMNCYAKSWTMYGLEKSNFPLDSKCTPSTMER